MNTHEIVLDGIEIALKLKNNSITFPSRTGSQFKKNDKRGTIMRVCSQNIENFFKANTSNKIAFRTNNSNQDIPPIGIEVWVRKSRKGIHVRSVIDSMQINTLIKPINPHYINNPVREILYHYFLQSNFYPTWSSNIFPIINQDEFMDKKRYSFLDPYHKEILFEVFKNTNSSGNNLIDYILQQINYIEQELPKI